ncbi:hypothetical protein [Ktedonobacter sp. SOSP1-52]|uniref:hypothetical protein n=1 Tax=Ktedonobacter sp. SOSP1-52 TaxID=2778366 RepID=UPI001915107F|nr:hypothetical protein [Ktedonobacter sp. SOSP1-52]
MSELQAVSPHQTTTPSSASHYPAFLVSNPPETPQPGLPYTARNVYEAFLAAGMKMTDVKKSNGWACCVTYQPEGKLVVWEETYGEVLEIAVFATSAEAHTVAPDLLAHSAGYSVSTTHACLFFYHHALAKAHLADYTRVLSKVCT